ncbi:MAG: DEAD/DEAH box helicase [Opitutales bacterium]|nr:DEAD/DEAH box helicase [Opitutales bacterium]MCH8540527.1 DEAD/DEAH box helicase [Opitutales bacterium]
MFQSSFTSLDLPVEIERVLAKKGYATPSPIQAQAIPVVAEGSDLLACAQTGTGKTAAFALPMLTRLSKIQTRVRRREIRSLVLTPTRELAVQVAESFQLYGANLSVSVGLAFGGVSQHPQVKAIRNGLDVLVATPGRLLDLANQGHVDFGSIQIFVLDEADRMLDMGFIPDIRKIASQLPTERQTLFFSATLEPEVSKLAQTLLRNPAEIRIAPETKTADKIDQTVLFVSQSKKMNLLRDLLSESGRNDPKQLHLVFSRTKHGAKKLAASLKKDGFRADDIHGNKSQAARQRSLKLFREGKTSVLVATDVAARGIDVKNIGSVINYDAPMEPESYVHRIGRTARAGAAGRAVLFCSEGDMKQLRGIEKVLAQKIPTDREHPLFDEKVAALYENPSRGGKSSGGGNRRSSPRSGGGPRFAGRSGPRKPWAGRRNKRAESR